MTWASFCEFVLMRELGTTDSIMRNYDLAWLSGAKPGMALDRAFAAMGFDQKSTPRIQVLPTVQAQLRNCGYNVSDLSTLADTMREWHNWHRIREGELRNWKYKEGPISLL